MNAGNWIKGNKSLLRYYVIYIYIYNRVLEYSRMGKNEENFG